ncbi:MAG: response regulator [Cyanobacteria bacterium P01_A01_bin.84]
MEINPHTKPVVILLGEDNPGDVYLIRSSLADSKLYHSFYHVQDGEEVMAYLYQEKNYQNVSIPDLILLDLNLPKKNGFEVLAEVKADPKLKIIPIVILTSSNREKDIIKSYQLYANSYIVKPSDYFSFFQAIKKLEVFWLHLAKLPSPTTLNFN